MVQCLTHYAQVGVLSGGAAALFALEIKTVLTTFKKFINLCVMKFPMFIPAVHIRLDCIPWASYGHPIVLHNTVYRKCIV